MKLLIIAFVILLCGCNILQAKKIDDTCSQKMEKQALISIDKINSWQDMYDFYKNFKVCDDGAIAEGVSDNIIKLLIKQKIQFNKLFEDRTFQEFVLEHINELMTKKEAQIIKKKIKQCKKPFNDFCKKVSKKI